ncbi:lysophospholipid acyltransferase 7-like isoform X3 [Homarus americanus]|uniref:lysophospholipid acyltransferase 7-like isoform X3 n=1 Tax=Homarus americanus TaxID=6706 RepID=UPI001C4489F6|nr:lysophospholipid acyltransferase 7-like isoform X3 [Homarus americanus]
MKADDIVYLGLLITSIGFGQIYRRLGTPEARKWVGTCVGLGLTVAVSGWHILHPLLLTATNVLILQYSKSWCHAISFWWSFSYLLFFRVCHYIGVEMAPGHTNAVQMMITLKLIGICCEVHDTWRKRGEAKKEEDKEKKAQLELELKYEEVDPSPMDIFHYAFCYVGVLTGPYYKYRVYTDMLQGTPLSNGLDCLQAMLWRIWVVPLYAIAFLMSDYFFPLSFAEDEAIFRDYGFFYRMWYMTPVFFNFRMRIYAAFVLSECVCIMAGLGAYPVVCEPKPGRGPSKYEALEMSSKKVSDKIEYNFETIHNIDEFGADFTPTVRGGMRCWNMTVQFWLVNNVYKRLKLARPIKEALTMFASAYWHGVYSGYYLSMLTVPFILAVEDYFDRLVRRKLGDKGKYVYDWLAWFVKMQNFAYMGMAFLLLRVDTTLHYWHSIGYIYHGLLIMMHCIAQYVNLIVGKAAHKLKKSRATAVIDDYTKMRFVKTKEVDADGKVMTAKTKEVDADGEMMTAKTKEVDADGEMMTAKTKEVDADGEVITAKTKEVDADGEVMTALGNCDGEWKDGKSHVQ